MRLVLNGSKFLLTAKVSTERTEMREIELHWCCYFWFFIYFIFYRIVCHLVSPHAVSSHHISSDVISYVSCPLTISHLIPFHHISFHLITCRHPSCRGRARGDRFRICAVNCTSSFAAGECTVDSSPPTLARTSCKVSEPTS